jgi:hypothetical protein
MVDDFFSFQKIMTEHRAGPETLDMTVWTEKQGKEVMVNVLEDSTSAWRILDTWMTILIYWLGPRPGL